MEKHSFRVFYKTVTKSILFNKKSPQQFQKHRTGHCTGENDLLGNPLQDSLSHIETGYQELRLSSKCLSDWGVIRIYFEIAFSKNRNIKEFSFPLPSGCQAASSTAKPLQQPHGRRKVSFLACT